MAFRESPLADRRVLLPWSRALARVRHRDAACASILFQHAPMPSTSHLTVGGARSWTFTTRLGPRCATTGLIGEGDGSAALAEGISTAHAALVSGTDCDAHGK